MDNTSNFAFLVHPPEIKDVAKKFSVARFIPSFLLRKIIRFLPPLFGAPITGFKLPDGRQIEGAVIICPLTAQQLVDNPELGKKKVLQSVRFAEKLGYKYIGLGAFTSIVTDGGEYLLDKVSINITTGNAYAAALAIENLIKISAKVGISLEESTLAVVGAAGSVGSACSKILAKKVKKIILLDKRADELKEIAGQVRNINPNTEAEPYLPEPLKADAVITVTSSAEGIIKPRNLYPGTVVIDCAQPHNVAAEVVYNRQDILVVHSGIAYLEGIKIHMDVGIGAQEIYACLGEALIMVWRNWKGPYSIGKVKPEHVTDILDIAPQIGLTVAGFRNQAGKITEGDFERIKKVRTKI